MPHAHLQLNELCQFMFRGHLWHRGRRMSESLGILSGALFTPRQVARSI